MGERGVAKPALIALAELGQFDDASGQNFTAPLGAAIDMESGAGITQRLRGFSNAPD